MKLSHGKNYFKHNPHTMWEVRERGKMGMYTEIYVNCELKELPPVLECMVNGDKELFEGELPKHSLFSKDRWSYMLQSSSYYHVPFSTFQLKREGSANPSWYLTGRSDLKNYDGEIEAFFDWLMPYIDAPEGMFIGYSRYEEADEPKLYFKTNNPQLGDK